MIIDMSRLYYDVIIIGGGIAGCSTALSVGRSNPGASVLILDDADQGVFKIGESLPAAGKALLRSLLPRLYEQLSKDQIYITCSGNASAWGSPELEETYAIVNPFGMGWHLNRALFDQVLRDVVQDASLDTITLVKATFTSVASVDGGDQWYIMAKDGASGEQKSYNSRWLIDASGRKATVAHKLGSSTVKVDALLAFYAVFVSPPTHEDHDHRTLIEACDSGWWYSSLLPSNHRVVVYHTDDTDQTSRDARKTDGFINLLHDTTRYISRIITDGEYDLVVNSNTRYPVCTAAGSSFLRPLCSPPNASAKWCAVGDAAMAYDPLSSQGMITALKMGCLMGDLVAKSLVDVSQDPTSVIEDICSQVWSKYEREKWYFYSQVKRFDGDFWRARR